MEKLENYVGAGEAAQILQVSSQRVRQLLSQGRLEYLQTPIGRLILRTEVERLALERAEKRNAH